jgi:hypothetical protein
MRSVPVILAASLVALVAGAVACIIVVVLATDTLG